MVNSILIEGGHKVVCKVLNREIFLAKRNSVSNLLNVKAAREGDAEAKSRLVQMAYNDPRHRLLWSCSGRGSEGKNPVVEV